MPPAKPKNADELQLEAAQRDVTKGLLADDHRKRLLYKLWTKGMTQRELAERLTRASVAAGGKPITENGVYKLIAVIKREMDAEEAKAS